MNTSIFMFAAGAALGVAGTLIVPTTQQNQPQTQSTVSNGAIEDQLGEIATALDSLNATTTDLQNLVQKYTYVMPTVSNNTVSKAQPATNKATETDATDDNAAFARFMNELQGAQGNSTAQVTPPTVASTPPTQVQIEQYQSIETRLFSAANDKTVNLSQLVQDASKLTKSQRDELTIKAVQMIENGELNPTQFNPPQGS